MVTLRDESRCLRITWRVCFSSMVVYGIFGNLNEGFVVFSQHVEGACVNFFEIKHKIVNSKQN